MLASGDESGNVMLWRTQPTGGPSSTDPPTGISIRPRSTVPHSIELVEDERVVERGDYYKAIFVVRNADGEPLEGVEVKLSLGQWVFEPVGTLQLPPIGRVANDLGDWHPNFLPDNVLALKPGEQVEEIPIRGWRVKPVASDSFNTALTNNEGKAEFRQRLHSEGEYGVSATVLRNGQEFLTTSFSTGDVPNTKVIDITSLESAYTRESDGWRREHYLYKPPVPAYRVKVIPPVPIAPCTTDTANIYTR